MIVLLKALSVKTINQFIHGRKLAAQIYTSQKRNIIHVKIAMLNVARFTRNVLFKKFT